MINSNFWFLFFIGSRKLKFLKLNTIDTDYYYIFLFYIVKNKLYDYKAGPRNVTSKLSRFYMFKK